MRALPTLPAHSPFAAALRARTVVSFGLVLLGLTALGLLQAQAGQTDPALPDPYVVQVTGAAHGWLVRYPGADGVLGTADDVNGERDLRVPMGVTTRVVLHSRDFVYVLQVPELALNQIAVPALEFDLTLTAAAEGTYPMAAAELCGFARGTRQGHVIVEPSAQHRRALRQMRAP
ncbi:MAG: hypothetical protein O2894_06765 [Planctomycetota bacterium]|nr:hypothetical protein [Planctomycetota bacterium]